MKQGKKGGWERKVIKMISFDFFFFFFNQGFEFFCLVKWLH